MKVSSNLEYLSELSNTNVNELRDFFKTFKIDIHFPAHQNLLVALKSVLNSELSKKIFNALIEYQKLNNYLSPFYKSDLQPVGPAGKKGNPVLNVGERPVTAMLFMVKDLSENHNNIINLLSLVTVLALLSKNNSAENQRYINKAATQLRIFYGNKYESDELLNFGFEVQKVHGIHHLIEILKTKSQNKNNSEPYKSLLKITPLIDTRQKKNTTVKKSLINISDATEYKVLSYTFNNNTHKNCIKSNQDNKNNIFIITEDNHTYDLSSETISKAILKDKPKEVYKELDQSISATELEIYKHSQRSNKRKVIDTSYLKYKTNLFNEIERELLADTLKEHLNSDSSVEAALILCLSICMNKSCLDILNSSFGNNGLLRADGKFSRKVSDASMAKRVKKNKLHLYTIHLNDTENNLIFFDLPKFIQKPLLKYIEAHKKANTISDLFSSTNHELSKQAQQLIHRLNKKHGQRFNFNRVKSQLHQYIKAALNDPCLSFAIYGKYRERAPTAFYYRSITSQNLIETFKEQSENYFKP